MKRLFENFLSLSILQVINICITLVTLPYVLRVLGPENYGIVVLANSVVMLFHSIIDYSFKISATRDVSIFRDSNKKLNIIYSKVMFIKSLMLLFSIIIITVIVFSYEPFRDEKLTFFLTTLTLFGYVLFPDWFFQGIEKMKYITIINSSIKILFAACIFIFIDSSEDYWMYPLFISLGYLIAGIVSQYILCYKFSINIRYVKLNSIIVALKENFPIFINQFLPNLYNNFTVIILGLMVNTYSVGVYDAIKKVTDLGVTLISIISRVSFPYLNRDFSAFKKYRIYIFTTALLMSFIFIVINPLIFWYLDLNGESDIIILTFLSLSIIGYTLYDVYGVNYFIIKRKDSLVMKSTIIASMIGFVAVIPLVYFFSIVGAAFNLFISRFMMGGYLYYKSRIST